MPCQPCCLNDLLLAAGAAGMPADMPFSFVYQGKSSAELLPGWRRQEESATREDGGACHTVSYSDPLTGLQVRCVVTRFSDTPAVEWVLYCRNTGAVNTPLLERVLPLELALAVPAGEVTLHRLHGSTCSATDFLPIDEPVAIGANLSIAPDGGRSSNGQFPFFNLAWSGGGVLGAIGWSGQWALQVQRDEGQLLLQAGQQTTALTLRPGEEIRTPRILLVPWQGEDRLLGHNLLRRLLREHYLPRLQGEVAPAPVTLMTWFTFNTGNDTTEANQLAVMPVMQQAGVEGYWLDAGWFEGGWPNGAGSWVPKPEAFPRGLKPLGDEAHRRGLSFVLWFEPERVTPSSRVAREHPEWVMHYAEEPGWGALFNLGDPAARQWLTDYLSQCISDWGIDVYRNDFNIDPLPFWTAADAPDRRGIAEIRYIEGLYALWDELLQRHPGLLIDNCSSGGRRIDLETMSRSIPLWQSDTQCGERPMPVWDQVQNAGLSQYVPQHAAGVWAFDNYNFRSIATTGCSLCPDLCADPRLVEEARRMIAEVKSLRPYYLGDYYPLLEITLDECAWSGWQYFRPDLGEGFLMLFRRARSPYPSAEITLHGLDAAATYRLTDADTGVEQTLSGSALADKLLVTIPSAPGSVLIRVKML